eukprot:7389236-Prymnesium_polylepis.1
MQDPRTEVPNRQRHSSHDRTTEEQIFNDQAEEERRRYKAMRVAQDKASIAAANEKTASRFSLVAPCFSSRNRARNEACFSSRNAGNSAQRSTA